MNTIPYKKDTKKILEEIDKLNPFERIDLIDYLVDKEWDENRIEKLVEGLGYVQWDSIDFVKEIRDQGLEYEVLDEMWDSEIAEYCAEHGIGLKDMLSELDNDDIGELLSNYDIDDIAEIIVAILNEHKNTKNNKFTLGNLTDKILEKI